MHPPGEGHAAPAATPPAWLGAPRWRFLQRVAHVLQHAATARQAAAAAADGQAGQHAGLRECLSLHLAALQLLEHAMEAQAGGAAASEAEPATAADLAAAAAELQADAALSMDTVEEAAAALDKAGQEPSPTAVTPAAAAVAAAEASLPDPWELLYAVALAWGREAAVDELLGNQARSCRLYARAGTALRWGWAGQAAAVAMLCGSARLLFACLGLRVCVCGSRGPRRCNLAEGMHLITTLPRVPPPLLCAASYAARRQG